MYWDQQTRRWLTESSRCSPTCHCWRSSLLAADSIRWSPFWITIGIVFLVERLVTVWAVGWRGRLLAAPIFVELAYALFLQVCFVTSILQMATGREAGWNGRSPSRDPRRAAGAVRHPPPGFDPDHDWYQALCLWVGFNTLIFVLEPASVVSAPSTRVAASSETPRAEWATERAAFVTDPMGADVDGGRAGNSLGENCVPGPASGRASPCSSAWPPAGRVSWAGQGCRSVHCNAQLELSRRRRDVRPFGRRGHGRSPRWR